MDRGIVYVAYGEKARVEAAASITSLRCLNNQPVAVVSNESLPGVQEIHFDEPGPGARWAKLNIDRLSPWQYTMYIDADTRIRVDLSAGFDILADGWDLVIVPSQNQGDDLLWHVGEEERMRTLYEIGNGMPLQLQAGVFWFRKSEAVRDLFTEWRKEWQRWRDQDQAAFLRALAKCPVKTWLLGHPWNGGACIAHLFGQTRG